MGSRRVRAFKRWMQSVGVEYSDAFEFTDTPEQGIAVRALYDLKKGDIVAKIPKSACLTIKTSGASDIIEAAGLCGSLGLAVALMYEKSLGEKSPWAGYLQLLPEKECLPLVWSLGEVDSLLCGTELHKTVKEDKSLIYEDWKESILPLTCLDSFQIDPEFFTVEQYFFAKSLIASRSFEIDDYHGSGMVPLADLFNHKTGAEDVHFMAVSSNSDSDSDADDSSDELDETNHDSSHRSSDMDENGSGTSLIGKQFDSGSQVEVLGDDPTVLQMVMVKDVKAGDEVYNTYGSMGNAALLHRYGFTEQDNPYNIVNIDLQMVLQWSSSKFSGRYTRTRLSFWRKLDYSGCVSQNSEYFEISSEGEPQIELLILLHIMLLPEDAFRKLDLDISTSGNLNGSVGMLLPHTIVTKQDALEMRKEFLLTEDVCKALLSLADMRESCYGPNTMKDDIEALRNCCCVKDRMLYHSFSLRVSERKILKKLREYAATARGRLKNVKRSSVRKKLKRA